MTPHASHGFETRQPSATPPRLRVVLAAALLACWGFAADAAERKADPHPLSARQYMHQEQVRGATPALDPGQPAQQDQFLLLDAAYGEAFRHHPTYLYVPSARLDNGKRGLLVVLHGCAQTAAELQKWGNLEAAAAHGLVVAAPSVGDEAWSTFPSAGCWDFDISAPISPARDKLKHLIALAQQLASDKGGAGLDIDPNHVYVTGLSSGGATSLLLACAAPELVAGVAAVAGPAVGSSQGRATADKSMIFYGSSAAADKCRELAQGHDGLSTQIANVVYGVMDRNGDKAGREYSPVAPPSDFGKFAVATTEWSRIDANMFATLYQQAAGDTEAITIPKPTTPVDGGKAKVSNVVIDGKDRIALTEIATVGHAWPSGKPEASPSPWIATRAMNYPDYIAGWLISHNVRATKQARAACEETVATAAEHVRAGRARLDSGDGLVHAVGSNQPLGEPDGASQHRLARIRDGFFVADRCH